MKRILVAFSLALLAVASLSAQSDTQAPKVIGLSITPSTVDVTLAARQVSFDVHLTDDLSGLNLDGALRIILYVRSPSRTQLAMASPPVQSGVILDANVTINVTIPRFAEPGVWAIDYIRLTDLAGNVDRPTGAFLAANGFPTTFNVIDTTPDVEAPRLNAITLTPRSVDVSTSEKPVTIDIAVTDDASGFNRNVFPNYSDFELASPSGQQSRYIPIRDWVRTSGSNVNGIWRATLVMPRYSEPGLWKVKSIRLIDFTGTQRNYTPAELASFTTAIELTVTSIPSDATPPELTAMSVAQAVVNTTTGDEPVLVQMNVTDALSGVSFASDRVGDPNYIPFSFGGIAFRSPSGAQTVFSNTEAASGRLLSGTPLNGLWGLDVVFPQFCEEGTWTVSVNLRDATRNIRTYTAAQLAARGLPATMIVIRPSLEPDGGPVDAAGGTVVDDTFGARAKLIIPSGCFSQATEVAIDVLESPLGVPLPTGFSSAETYFVNVQFTPQPSFPLPAPGITVVLPLRDPKIPGTQINLLRVNPATGSLEPALDVSGAPIIGQVDAGGQTATFAGVARFSTVVGVLPTAISVNVDIKPGDTPNTINTKSKGTIPVAIFSTATLDLSKVEPSTLNFSGAPVAQNEKGKWQIAYADLNDDGTLDVIAHFETEQILLLPGDALGLIEGRTQDGRLFRGIDSVRVVK
jgi:hypothetical protein